MSAEPVYVQFVEETVYHTLDETPVMHDLGDYIAGPAGWSPELAVVVDGERRVHQVVDWFGGAFTKPATGQYLGATGFVTDIADAVDVRGPSGAGGSLGSLPEYVSHEAAILGGLSVGDFFVIAPGSDIGPAGTVIKVQPV